MSMIPDILQVITNHDNIGDMHFKMILKYPAKYNFRKELIEMFILSFFKTLWNKDNEISAKINLDILAGSHNESAFVEVRSDKECEKAMLTPLLPNKNKFASILINHLDAISVRRAQMAEFFSNKINHHQDPVDGNTMFNRLNHHGYIALDITGSYVAKNLPFYTINLA